MKALKKLTNAARRNPGIVWALVAALVALAVWRFVSATDDDKESAETCKGKKKYYDPNLGKCMDVKNCKGLIKGGLCDTGSSPAVKDLYTSIECKKNRDKWWDPVQKKCRWADQCMGTVTSAGKCVNNATWKPFKPSSASTPAPAPTGKKGKPTAAPGAAFNRSRNTAPPGKGPAEEAKKKAVAANGGLRVSVNDPDQIVLRKDGSFSPSYDKPKFGGDGKQLAVNLESGWDDEVRTLYIPKGRSVMLFEGKDGQGAQWSHVGEGKNVDLPSSMRKKASSIMSWAV